MTFGRVERGRRTAFKWIRRPGVTGWLGVCAAGAVAIIVPLVFGAGDPSEAAAKAERHFEEGTAFNKQRRFDDAIEQFASAVTLDRDNHKYHHALFMTYISTRRGRQGLETYIEMAKQYPDQSVVRYWLGRFYLQSQSLEDAANAFRAAAELDPDDEHAWISLGHVYDRLGRDDDALEAYREANRFAPEVASVHAGLGKVYVRKGDDAKAFDELTHALRLDPALTEARFALSMLYERHGELDRAMEEWARLLEDDPNQSRARERLARAYVETRRYEEAVKEFSTLAQVRQGSVEIQIALGEALILLAASREDQTERAEVVRAATESFSRVLEMDPSNQKAKSYLKQLAASPASN